MTQEKVVSLENLYVMTAPYVAEAERQEKAKEEKRRQMRIGYVAMEEQRRFSKEEYEDYEIVKAQPFEEQKKEVLGLLRKAGIHPKDFPFAIKKDEEGNDVKFAPKGKNEKEIKEEILKFKTKMQESLEKGKMTQEEFDRLNAHLEAIMEDNDIVLEEEKDKKDGLEFELSNDEIEDELEKLVIHNFGNEKAFEKLCEEYKDYDLDERKNCLEEFNSRINQQLGIAGDLKFSSNPNMKFENSFTDKGYYLTEKEVETQDLKPILYTMMEKAKMREFEIKNEQKISMQKKKAMHDKIMEERKRKYKKQKDQQDRKNAQKVMQRMRTMS